MIEYLAGDVSDAALVKIYTIICSFIASANYE